MKTIQMFCSMTFLISATFACDVVNDKSGLAADSISVEGCSISILGKEYKGNSKEECDKLKADRDASLVPVQTATPTTNEAVQTATSTSNEVYACDFAIDGINYKGASEEECAQLKIDLGIKDEAPEPEVKETESASQSTVVAKSCTYANKSGTYKGTNEAECAALEQKYGAAALILATSTTSTGSSVSACAVSDGMGANYTGNTAAECEALLAKYAK